MNWFPIPRECTGTYVPGQIIDFGEFPGNSTGRCNQELHHQTNQPALGKPLYVNQPTTKPSLMTQPMIKTMTTRKTMKVKPKTTTKNKNRIIKKKLETN